jgi:AcrR family transcriptional regulator
VRVQGRSARVVEAVLEATAEELGRVGFLALRIDDVAALSGVNKTTIYRRWPTKEDLVASMLETLTVFSDVPDTGSLRSDLSQLLHDMKARSDTPVGRGIIRLIQAERGRDAIASILRKNRAEHLAVRRAIFERASARGEIPEGSETSMLVELAVAPLIARLLHGAPLDEQFIEVLVNTVAAGAAAGGARVSAARAD